MQRNPVPVPSMRRAASGLEGAWRMRERGSAATRTRFFGLSALLRNGAAAGLDDGGAAVSAAYAQRARPAGPHNWPSSGLPPVGDTASRPCGLPYWGLGGKRKLRRKAGFAAAAQNGSRHAPAAGITLRVRRGVWMRCGGMWSEKMLPGANVGAGVPVSGCRRAA